jgi:hypothetical protein
MMGRDKTDLTLLTLFYITIAIIGLLIFWPDSSECSWCPPTNCNGGDCGDCTCVKGLDQDSLMGRCLYFESQDDDEEEEVEYDDWFNPIVIE